MYRERHTPDVYISSSLYDLVLNIRLSRVLYIWVTLGERDINISSGK